MKRTADNYFTGEIRADAEGDYLGDVIITLGADSYRLRSEAAETLAAEIDWAVANGHYTGEDIDAVDGLHRKTPVYDTFADDCEEHDPEEHAIEGLDSSVAGPSTVSSIDW